MKCKVVKGFIDKETKKPYDAGDEFECSRTRFDEIQKKGMYLSEIEEKAAGNGTEKPEKASKK